MFGQFVLHSIYERELIPSASLNTDDSTPITLVAERTPLIRVVRPLGKTTTLRFGKRHTRTQSVLCSLYLISRLFISDKLGAPFYH